MPKTKSQTTKTDSKEENIFTGRKYIRAVGRRKSASAQVKIFTGGTGIFLVNRQPLEKYFPHFELRAAACSPLESVNKLKEFDVTAVVAGGGKRGQSEAVLLGVARALVLYDEKLRSVLRKLGFMTVDSRVKERKKPGLKRARRAPQWAKR
ncbi:MAG: 30S ribosomal protein S9 [Candidatus Komeilibacteria bacterium]|nr:30S ribosomal protein S9 [Candidatus Komeilibacteria bacterium]